MLHSTVFFDIKIKKFYIKTSDYLHKVRVEWYNMRTLVSLSPSESKTQGELFIFLVFSPDLIEANSPPLEKRLSHDWLFLIDRFRGEGKNN